MILEIGRIISNRYQILEQIGSGGMSVVYRALDTNLQRDVTFKVLREEYTVDASFVARFGIEARSVASLNHPNIVKAYDAGEDGDIRYIVMEYVPGKTLKELILERAPFENEVMLGVVSQIVAALAHAHENGVIHKDVKPQNILVSPDGDVKVTDFGIADSKNAVKIVNADSTMGSVHYISPEIACNDPADARSDLYSLGITMYEMMTNQLPFDSENADEIPKMHVEMPIPNIMKKNPKVLPLVREIIIKLTNKYPHQRYQSANSLQNDIQRAILECEKYREYQKNNIEPRYKPAVDQPPRASSSRPRPDRNQKKPEDIKRERMLLAGGIVVAALVLTGIVFGAIALINLFSDDTNGYVTPPPLEGRHVDDVRDEMEALGLYLEIAVEEYHQYLPEGYIIRTNVTVEGQLAVGTTIQVAVSLGEEGGERIEVPDITGLHISQAVQIVLDMPIYIVQNDPVFSDTVQENHIISQEPEPGTMVAFGSNIYIVYSMGAVQQLATVPNLQGMTETTARTSILSAGLNVGMVTVEESETVQRGQIISQSIPPNQQRPLGTAIDFVISDGILEVEEPTDQPPPPTDQQPPQPPATDEDDQDQDDDIEPPTDEDEDDPAPPEPTISSYGLSITPALTEGVSYNLSLARRLPNGALSIVETRQMTSADLPWNVVVQGYGTMEFVLLVNNLETFATEVNFD